MRTIYFLFLLILVPVFSTWVAGQGDLTVLEPDLAAVQEDEMMRRYLRNLSAPEFQKRKEKLELLDTPGQIKAYQKELKEYFLEVLRFPERTPLNPGIVGRQDFNNYRLEKIIYESQPGFHVPAHMYLPAASPPYPGILVLAGHENEGKAAYQEICISLVHQGFAVLCPDPVGQGERKQILDESGQRIHPATTEHMIEGVVPLLLGQSLTTHMVWDGIRALDYLTSRPDIDPERVGCLGNSGGGNRTSYLMAIDERVSCAAVCSFITTNARKNYFPGPGDAEQNIYGQIRAGMDHADYIIMRAPKPTLVISPTRDFVPVEGAWEAYREANRVYTNLGFPEHVGIHEANGKHGLTPPVRKGMVRWMKRWLMGMDEPVVEEEIKVLQPAELKCSPEGQVLLMEGARSIFDLCREQETDLAGARSRFFREHSGEEIRNRVRELAGIRELADLPGTRFEKKGVVSGNGYQIVKGVIHWETDIVLPVLDFIPDKKNGECYIYLHEKGKSVLAEAGGEIEQLVHEGNEVWSVDIRGFGETATSPWRYEQAHGFTGHDVAEFYIAFMLGKSFVGMRAEDILAVAKYIMEKDPSPGRRIHLAAWGNAGTPALHAMVLEPDLFQSLILNHCLGSWHNAVQSGITKDVLVNVVPGAMEYYDLPDLAGMAPEGKIRIINPR